MTYLGGNIECECGEWYAEHLKKCPECGEENTDEGQLSFTFHCSECSHNVVVSTTKVTGVYCPVCSSPMVGEND